MDNRFDTNRFNTSSVAAPVTSSNLASDFVASLPGAADKVGWTIGNFLSDVAKSIGRSVVSVGSTIALDLTGDKRFEEIPLEGITARALGTDKIKNLGQQVADNVNAIQQSDFAKRNGFDKFAWPLGILGVGVNTGLDITFGGEGEGAFIKKLAQESDEGVIFKLLKEWGVSDNLAKGFAPRIAATGNEEEIKTALNIIRGAEASKGIAEAGGQTISDFGGQTTPQIGERGASAFPQAARSAADYIPEAGLPSGSQSLETPGKQLVQRLSEGVPGITQSEAQSFGNIIGDAARTVKDKVHIMDFLQTPELVLEKIGLGKQAAFLRDAYDAYRTELKAQIGKLVDWQKEVSGIPGASQRIFQFMDGQPIQLSGIERKVATEMQNYLKDWANRLHLPEDSRIANYITHIFEHDLITKEFDPDLAKLIADKIPGSVYDPFLERRLGAKGYIQDAFAAMDAYVKRATRKVNMDPALEHLKAAGEMLDLESEKYVMALAHQINLRPTLIDNYVDNFVKSTLGYRFGQRPVARVTRTIRQIIYRAKLGLNVTSALKNLTQGVNTYAKLGEKYTVIGYSTIMSRMASNNLEELYHVGVLEDAIIQDRQLGVYKSLMKKIDPALFVLFDTAEKINRGAAYFGAKAKYIAGGMTEEKAITAAKRLVRDTQFAFGTIDTPVALGNDLVKTFLQFQTYNLKQLEFLKNMVKNKELAGLVRYTVASIFVISTVGQALGMKPSDIIPTIRVGGAPGPVLAADLFNLGKSAVTADIKGTVTAGKKVGGDILGLLPASTQIKKILFPAKTTTKTAVPSGNRFNL
jgi:hypothetical protein